MFTQATSPSNTTFCNPSSRFKDLFLIGMGSILISLCALISIPLPFTPVPIALAPHICLTLGIVLGKNRGSLAVLSYLLQGAIGFPVFALGKSGVFHFFGPSGGYLFGYVAAAYVTGYLFEKMREATAYNIFSALTIGNGIIYLFGAFQLSFFVGFKSAILLGILPFLIGDFLKLMVISKGMKRFFS